MQSWATFSIVDHRQPIYRQALAIFDKIVVPVPDSPIGDQSVEELAQLNVELDYLVENSAAVRYPWDSMMFQQWKQDPSLAEAVSASLNRDLLYDTRLMLAQTLASDDVETVPVYGDHAAYESATKQLYAPEIALKVAVTQRLPVPDQDTPLDDIIRLRNENAAFQTAVANMLEWKRGKAREVFGAPDRDQAVAAAMRDFDRITKEYAEAMDAAGHKRLASVASIFISAATGDVTGVIKEGLVSFCEFREPIWKSVADKKYAAGGVVYHFKEALG